MPPRVGMASRTRGAKSVELFCDLRLMRRNVTIDLELVLRIVRRKHLRGTSETPVG